MNEYEDNLVLIISHPSYISISIIQQQSTAIIIIVIIQQSPSTALCYHKENEQSTRSIRQDIPEDCLVVDTDGK